MDTKFEIVSRLKRIFDSFLQQNFVTTNAVYFEKLITHLAAPDNAYVLQAPFALEWVDKCMTILSEDFTKLNPKVISFMLNFIGLLISNEWVVIEIRERRMVDRVMEIVHRNSHQFNPSMKLGIIRMLAAVSRYSLGLAHIRSTKAWRFLIEYCNQDHTVYVVREARHLLYELLFKLCVKTNDEQVVLEMLEEIFKPLHENVFQDHEVRINVNVDDPDLQHRLSSTLELISYLFQQTLESEEKIKLAFLCREHHHVERTLWKLTEMTQNANFLAKILTALSSFYFARLVYEKWSGGQIEPEKFTEFGISFFNLMKFCVSRGDCINFLNMAALNHKLWKKLGKRAPPEIQIENERVRFENQLISFHMLPVHFTLQSGDFLKEELFDKYLMKIFEIVCEQTLRICYAFRELLFRTLSPALTADLAYKAIYSILSMENVLERDQAVIVFQAVIYAVRQIVITSNEGEMGEHPAKSLHTNELQKVLYAALVALRTLICRYKITWTESLETICLVNCSLNVLGSPDVTTRVAVQALKLIQLSIEQFLSPNMALLIDNLKGSSLAHMGPVIVKRFHDPAWEVRDSTLELLSSIATISQMKYPAFQPFLVEGKFCPIVWSMAKHDSEPYVRASALKCIAQMIPINLIWEHELGHFDLVEHLLFVLYNESEGLVRAEAVTAISKIHAHRKISQQHRDVVFSTLAYSVVDDLHWEVKANALLFWRQEVRKQLCDQGMIDGTFPTVTFSKEKKKIVTLTAKEINLRILKVLTNLADKGFLGVMLKCLNDDCDLAVIKVAMSMLKRMLEQFKRYNYECSEEETRPLEPEVVIKEEPLEVEENDVANEVVDDELLDRDAIIESILDAQDINLLVAACEQHMHMNGDEPNSESVPHENDKPQVKQEHTRSIDPFYYRRYANVRPKEFVDIVKDMDFDQLLHKQHEWFLCSESFASLLEDILRAIKPDPENDSISADCY